MVCTKTVGSALEGEEEEEGEGEGGEEEDEEKEKKGKDFRVLLVHVVCVGMNAHSCSELCIFTNCMGFRIVRSRRGTCVRCDRVTDCKSYC